MPQITAADLAELFSDPAVTDTVTISGSPVTGYFFAPYANSLEIAGNKPLFRTNPAAVIGVVVGGTIIFSGTTYVITSRQLERAGTVIFELRVQ